MLKLCTSSTTCYGRRIVLHGTLGAAVLGLLGCLAASAQVDLDQVSIFPRTTSALHPLSPGMLRTQVDLVTVNVTVVDRQNRTVTGLDSAAFTVLDNNHPQAIRYVSNEDTPVSVVVIFDASTSMAMRIQSARDAVQELISTSNPQDEFSLIVVNSQAQVRLNFADPIADIPFTTASLQPDGFTALWDGIYLGMQKLQAAHYQRRALIVISDGGDNHSRYTESELKSLLAESDAELYALGTFERFPKRIEERRGPMQLDELASVTGGRLFSVLDGDDIRRAMAQISRELRDQYILGYYASHQHRDGKWHKLSVRLTSQPQFGNLRLYARKGYYASTP